MPLRPNPSQVPPAAQVGGGGGGGTNLHWASGHETRRGLWSAVSRRVVDFRRTDDEGPDAAGGGRLNTLIWMERRQKGIKERGDRKDALEGKEPG